MNIEQFFTQPFAVRRFTGEGATGPVFAEKVVILGRIKHENRIVINDKGNEVVSATAISISIDEDTIPPGSLVRVGDTGPWRTVIGESRHRGGFAMSPDYYSIDLN